MRFFICYMSVPPSSSPRAIYWSLQGDVDAADLHSAKIRDIRRGIQKGAAIKFKEGSIDAVEYREILKIVRRSQLADFKPFSTSLIRRIYHQAFAQRVLRCGGTLDGRPDMNILAYVESVPFEIGNEALFYCTRAFEVMAWPKELRRDIFFDAPSCEPGPESRALTLAILAGIEKEQGQPLDQIDRQILDAYARDIGDAGEIIASRIPGLDDERGEELLRQMRAGWVRNAPVEESQAK